MSIEGVTGWSELIAAVVAAGVAIGVAWKKWVWPAVLVVVDAIQLVRAQLAPNGGESLVDRVKRIDSVQQSDQKHFRRLEANDRAHERRIGKMEHDLERLKGGE